MRIYTFEHYRPAYPLQGDFVRIHHGTFEANRENFNPSMVRARDFYAEGDAEALSKGARAAAVLNVEFEGFGEDEEC